MLLKVRCDIAKNGAIESVEAFDLGDGFLEIRCAAPTVPCAVTPKAPFSPFGENYVFRRGASGVA